MKNNKRDKKHPLTEKVEKAFRGKKNTDHDAPAHSRGKHKPAAGDNKYAGLGKKYKGAEKTEPRNFKSKSGASPKPGSTKGRSSTTTGSNSRKTTLDSKGTGRRMGKPSFGSKPHSSFGKDTPTGKRFDRSEDKPKRGDRETTKKYPTESKTKRTFRKDSENAEAKSYGNKNKTPERYKKRPAAGPIILKKRKATEDESGLIRLNRYISNSGVCSRRDADQLISEGLVEVNGKVVTEMGYKVKPTDSVRYDGRLLNREKPVYLLLNKPKDFITTMDDPQERKTVMQLIAGACKERVYPVGRLDRNTTGLLLLTNDGALAERLTHPSHKISKVYQVELDRNLDRTDFATIAEGNIVLEDGPVKVDEIAYAEGSKKIIGLEIHEGRNRVVRRIFEHLGYEVEKLDRTMYAGLTKKDLPRGNWRFLTDKEITKLKLLK